MDKAVLGKLTFLCIICGLAVVVLLGMVAAGDGKREWKQYQAEFRELLLKKISRDRNPAFYDRVAGMKPEIKQVAIDEWGAVDRCITCHMGIDDPSFAGAPKPFAAHPDPALLKHHPVEKFGCTLCHGGQGMATTYDGASHKTHPEWPIPMVAKGLMQSRCGICHQDYEAIGADKLIKGQQLYKEMHCAGCHQINGQGGAVGPDLSAFADKDPGSFSYADLEGDRSKQTWVIEHFKDPKRVSPGTPMRAYAMNDYQIECLASYVLSLSRRDFMRHYTPKVRPDFVPHKLDVNIPEAELPEPAGDEAVDKK